MSAALPALLLGIARMGYRGRISERALSSLVAHAEEHGMETVLEWIRDDSGLLEAPSWQFYPYFSFTSFRKPRSLLDRRHVMPSVNKAILIGHLGRDPEVRYTESGTAVANFSIATTDRWTDATSGEKKERTEWHRIVAWGKLAEVAGEYLAKGKPVYVEGSLQTREWTDRDGNKRYTTEVRAQRMQLLYGREGAQAVPASLAGEEPLPAAHDEDVPF